MLKWKEQKGEGDELQKWQEQAKATAKTSEAKAQSFIHLHLDM